MIRFIAIAFSTLALLTILSSAGLAHHHHKEWVHMVVNMADDADCCTQPNTHSEHEGEPYADCVLDKPYCSTSQPDLILTKIIKDLFSVPFFHFYTVHQLYETDDSIRTDKYRTYIFPDIPDYVSFSKGLRAPPIRHIS